MPKHMLSIAFFRIPLIIFAACLLPACEERHYEVVERACQNDGHSEDYCSGLRREMKDELGFETYRVFTDLVVLGDSDEITSEAILATMEKNHLTPSGLADIREAIDNAGAAAEERCAG